jgi:uncharacterized protein
MLKVNSSFITPFDREDIYPLASKFDDCMDLMEAAADLICCTASGICPTGSWLRSRFWPACPS